MNVLEERKSLTAMIRDIPKEVVSVAKRLANSEIDYNDFKLYSDILYEVHLDSVIRLTQIQQRIVW
jgi:hypothetical protein